MSVRNEEPIATFWVSYKGGHPNYPTEKLGAINLELFDDRFEFHPSLWPLETVSWFKGLLIPFDRVLSIGFQQTMGSLVLSVENTIVIVYSFKSGREVSVRFQISAITVYGQEKKCRELKDLMRNHGIFAKFSGQPKPVAKHIVSAEDIPSQIEKLSTLRDKGIVSPDEFEKKKAELLARM